LTGFVLNLGDAGVRIVVEGEKSKITNLINQIKLNPPSISKIDLISVDWVNPQNEYHTFSIAKSSSTRNEGAITLIPPDVSICNDCVRDVFSRRSRWYLYPFTSCAACGPRLSTITDLPYDRPNTTMIDFPLCNNCNTGYTNPLDRRYHAQTTACQICGPNYELLDSCGKIIETDDVVAYSAGLLKEGNILAVQGLSGTHLVTITSGPNPIEKLRERKKRKNRPFAVMGKDLSSTKLISKPTKNESILLESWQKPIVLVKKNFDSDIAFEHELIAPGLDRVGVMLPYAAIHHLLFHYLNEPALVMTSANPTGIPMYVDKEEIVSKLDTIADFFLLHNRRIHQRSDDSVIKMVGLDRPLFIRRARGYAPNPVKTNIQNKKLVVLGLGAEEKVCASILNSNYIYQTQHIGDITHQETADLLIDTSMHYLHLLGIDRVDAIACDLHPEFITTSLGEEMSDRRNIPLIRVQHHNAHLAAIMGEHNLTDNTSIICITVDGFGYGRDKKAWGGEILVGNLEEYSRIGGLNQVLLPGGDISARFASRSLFGILRSEKDIKEILELVKGVRVSSDMYASMDNLKLLDKSIEKGINVIESSSAGRFLDAVSLLCGFASENTYDGECPMKLESKSEKTDMRVEIEYLSKDGFRFIDTSSLLRNLVDLKKQGVSPNEIAYVAQWQLGNALAEISCDYAIEKGIDYVGLSGGVAFNRIVTSSVVDTIRRYDLTPLIHEKISPGDGGISAGQVLVASKKLM
jgi:hydrogenase maturation protein HypF